MRAETEFLDVPHFAVFRRVHDEVAHIRSGGSQLQAQVERYNGEICSEHFLSQKVVLFISWLAGQGLQGCVADSIVFRIGVASMVEDLPFHEG